MVEEPAPVFLSESSRLGVLLRDSLRAFVPQDWGVLRGSDPVAPAQALYGERFEHRIPELEYGILDASPSTDRNIHQVSDRGAFSPLSSREMLFQRHRYVPSR